jgi:hypothetical protein
MAEPTTFAIVGAGLAGARAAETLRAEGVFDERHISVDHYANDIVWPTLALKKLAADHLKPTAAELQEAFDAQYGEAVKARLIAVKDSQTAQKAPYK